MGVAADVIGFSVAFLLARRSAQVTTSIKNALIWLKVFLSQQRRPHEH